MCYLSFLLYHLGSKLVELDHQPITTGGVFGCSRHPRPKRHLRGDERVGTVGIKTRRALYIKFRGYHVLEDWQELHDTVSSAPVTKSIMYNENNLTRFILVIFIVISRHTESQNVSIFHVTGSRFIFVSCCTASLAVQN